ncbi:BLOC-1-related complex subunit 7 isoform X2 [Mustela erminea]|uniref:BLOC-1-related complex subunit 7 isoform X2 n=1 Tax=Mustela erminea TaxID=36723 RepID=UPI001386E2F0|nr:BLOC-1-related complex subunit 7 isoform X2 [Mustela erminea]
MNQPSALIRGALQEAWQDRSSASWKCQPVSALLWPWAAGDSSRETAFPTFQKPGCLHGWSHGPRSSSETRDICLGFIFLRISTEYFKRI